MLLMDRPTGRVEASTPLTLDEYLALPEDARAEIVDGVLRPMTRTNKLHRMVQRRLATLIETQKKPELRVAEEEIVVFEVKPPTARIPDVVLFKAERDPDGLTNSTPTSEVLLAVEIVSPTTATADRFEKPAEYARNGIPSFWRIELEPDIMIHVHELAGDTYREWRRFHRRSVVTDPNLPWIKIDVGELLGDYA